MIKPDNKRNKRLYIWFFILWPIVGSVVSLSLNLAMFYSMLVFLVPPVLVVSILLPENILKSSFFSILTITPFAIVIDYIAHLNGQWLVLNNTLPHFLNYVAVEDVIWGILFMYFVVMFYEYFVDTNRNRKFWNSRMKYLLGFTWSLLAVFLVVYFTNPNLLEIPYFYLLLGIIFFVLPVTIELIRRPKLWPKFLVVASYFFFFAFIYELTALKSGQWIFPSDQFIGWVEVLGLRFPFEEFFFGFFFYSLITLTCYESFDDDEK